MVLIKHAFTLLEYVQMTLAARRTARTNPPFQARTAERIAEIVAQAPPITDEQRDRITALLRAGQKCLELPLGGAA